MQIALPIAVLVAAWFALRIYADGYPNIVDQLAWTMHKHAQEVRKMHAARAAKLNEQWLRELEGQLDLEATR